METTFQYSASESAQMEIRQFINEGLQDVYNNNLLDFNSTFNELEKRYIAND